MNRALHGSCHVPVAALARLEGAQLFLQGLVGDVARGGGLRAEARGPVDAPEALGQRVAAMLLDAGAGELISAAG